MIDRDVEETLNLVGMKVHCDEAVDTGYRQQVGNQLGADRHTRLVLAVLTSPAEIRDHRDDLTGRSTLGRIDHQQEFHQIVGIRESRLYQKNIVSSNGFFVRNRKLAICKMLDIHFAQGAIQSSTNFLSKVLGIGTRKDFDRTF